MTLPAQEASTIHFGSGVLFFPVTPFDPDGQVSLDGFTEHLERGMAWGPGGIFAACGTGEFFSLSVAEHEALTDAAVHTARGRCPVLVGAGGPLPVAIQHVKTAARAGAEGVLLMPPYLTRSSTIGVVDYVRAVAEVACAENVRVIVYHRPGLRLTPESAEVVAALPAVVGIKDGLGDIDLIARMRRAVRANVPGGESFHFFNGLPTAEMTAPAYRSLGIESYSSAVFCFAPEIAVLVREAVRDDNRTEIDRWISLFYGPFSALRATTAGYAVSLVKAGVALRGYQVGGVRAPLTDPKPEHVAELRRLLDDALAATGTTATEHGGVA